MSERIHKRRSTQPAWPCLLLVVTGLLLAAPGGAAIVNKKLNGPLVADGDVREYKISPDGNWVVYKADQDTDEAVELYRVSVDGGPPLRLNGTLPSGSKVVRFEITPDSGRVVYTAPQDLVGKFELYSVPIEGPSGAGVKINQELETEGIVFSPFQISLDGKWVIYIAKEQTNGPLGLFRAPIDGSSNPVQLNPNGSVDFPFRLSPAGDRVVYSAKLGTSQMFELFSVALEGASTDSTRIYTPSSPGAGLYSFQISPDGGRVVYLVDQQVQGQRELYSVPIVGPETAGVRLNGSLVPGGDVAYYQLSPDSSIVTYLADQQVDERQELYSVPIDGPAAAGVKLNGPVNPIVGLPLIPEWLITPDGTRVVYGAIEGQDLAYRLYSVPAGGPASARITLSELTPDSLIGVRIDMKISPDGSRVVYLGDPDGHLELFSVPTAGPESSRIRLNPDLGVDGDVTSFQIAPDGSRVAYVADRIRLTFGDEIFHLWSVPIGGPVRAYVRLNGSLVTGGDVFTNSPSRTAFQFTPDSHRVVYLADQDTDEINELYVSYDRPAAARGWIGYR